MKNMDTIMLGCPMVLRDNLGRFVVVMSWCIREFPLGVRHHLLFTKPLDGYYVIPSESVNKYGTVY